MEYKDTKIMTILTQGDISMVDIHYEDDIETVTFNFYEDFSEQDLEFRISFKDFNKLIKAYIDKKDEINYQYYQEARKDA